MKYTKEQIVNAAMLGNDECLSVIGTFQIIENALTELTGILKIDGITVREKYNAIWVFAKTRVKFFNKILWNEKCEVSCFVSYKSLAKMNFDVEARRGNELIFYARVEACALDIATQRIKKLSTIGVDDSIQPETSNFELTFSNFSYDNLPLYEQIKVRSTNIDMSHHTNNLEYLTKPFKEMEVVYVSQSFEGDILDVLKTHEKDKDIIVLQKGGKQVVKCEILY